MSKVKIKKFDETKQRVFNALTKVSDYRDNDDRLISDFLYNDVVRLTGNSPEQITGKKLLALMYDGKLTPISTIRRARRYIQQYFPELRGTKWKERHKIDTEVRREIVK